MSAMPATTIDERLLDRACRHAATLRAHPGELDAQILERAAKQLDINSEMLLEHARRKGWLR